MLFLVNGHSNKSFILPKGMVIISLHYKELDSQEQRHMNRMTKNDRKRFDKAPKRIAFRYKEGLRTAIVGVDVVLV